MAFYVTNLLSRTFNTLTLGLTSETFCARVHKRNWKRLELILNLVFFPYEDNHCKRSFERCLATRKQVKLRNLGIFMLTHYDTTNHPELTGKKREPLHLTLKESEGLSAFEKHYLNFLKDQMQKRISNGSEDK